MIVAKVSDKEPGRRVLPLGRVIQAGYLTPAEVAFFQALADDLVQSPASLLDVSLPTPPKRAATNPASVPSRPLTLPADEAAKVRETAARLATSKQAFVCVPDLRRTAALVSAYLDAAPGIRLALVAPNVRDAELLTASLGRFKPAFVSGEETNNARFRAWQAVRHGETRLLIGTRIAALLPTGGDAAIWIARAAHDNHKNADQNPRYDTRAAAVLAERLLGARVIFSDVLPRPDDVAAGWETFDPFTRPTSVFADRAMERRQSAHPLLGPSVISRIEETLEAGKVAVCVYNRLGTAASLRCADCGFGFPCPSCGAVRTVEPERLRCRRCGAEEKIPIQCPHCQSFRVERRGVGSQTVLEELRAAFPQVIVDVSAKDAPPTDWNARIVLATQHWLENVFDPFRPPNVGLIALLDADMALRAPGFRGTERALTEAAEWQGTARACRADFLLQTDDPTLFRTALAEPFAWAAEELKRRIDYHQSPAVRLIRLTCRQEPAEEARKALNAIVNGLRQSFPEVIVATNIPSPPGTFAAELSVEPGKSAEILLFLRDVDDACVIDTDSIL